MEKPKLKYHVDKCLNIENIFQRMKEKYDLDLYNYKGINFYEFMNEKMMDNVVYPKMTHKKVYGDKDFIYDKFVGYKYVVEIPIHYDSSNDDKDYEERRESYLKRMMAYFNHKNDKTDEEIIKHVQEVDKHTNYGLKNWKRVNDILEKIHEEYSQYYSNGKVRVWIPREGYHWEGKEEFDYPQIQKSYKLSELIEYFDNKYGFDASDLYEWVLDYNFIEGRHWENIWSFHHDGDSEDFMRVNFKGKKAPESLEHVINIMEKEFQDESEKEIPIYVDFYKEYNYD